MDRLGVLRQSFCTLFWFLVLRPLCKLTNDASLMHPFTPIDIFLFFLFIHLQVNCFKTSKLTSKAWETAQTRQETAIPLEVEKIEKKSTTGSRNRDFEAANCSFFGPPNQFFQCFHLPHRTRPTTWKSSMPSLKEWIKCDKDSETQGWNLCFLPSPLPLPEGASNPSPSWTVAMQPSQMVWRVVWFPPKSNEKICPHRKCKRACLSGGTNTGQL